MKRDELIKTLADMLANGGVHVLDSSANELRIEMSDERRYKINIEEIEGES